MKKRILSVILVAVMLLSTLSLSACKEHTSAVDAEPAADALTTKNLDNIYQAQAISTLGTVFENTEIERTYNLADGKILVNCYDKDTYDQKYYITDIDLKNVSEMPISKPAGDNDVYVNSIITDRNTGDIWYVKHVYRYDAEDYSEEVPVVNDVFKRADIAVDDMLIDSVMPTLPGGDYTMPHESNYIVKVDLDGNIVSETDISEIMKITQEDGYQYSGYINGMTLAGETLVLNISGEKLLLVNTRTTEIKNEVSIDVNYIDNLFASASGEVFFSSWGENGVEFYSVNTETGKTEKAEFPLGENIYSYSFVKGEMGYDFWMSNNIALYGYNIGDAQPTEICNYANSDIDLSYGSAIPTLLDDGRLLLSYYDYTERENVLLALTKLDPSQIKEKYIITVAGAYLGSDIKSALMKFNRTSEDYKIVFKDYSSYNNESNEWTGAQTKLEQDIISKNDAPDIILVSSISNYDSLAAKGAFADLNTFIDSDESFDASKYLENVFKALESNGGLYRITPTVNFYTIAGKKSLFGDKTSLTMKEFLDMHKSLGEDERMFMEETRDGVGRELINVSINQFIEESGRCNFNSEEFKSLLEYLKDIPEDYTAYEEEWQTNNNYWQEMEMSYIKGTTKLYPVYISNFNVIPEVEAYLGEEAAILGFPTNDADSSGTIIYPGTMFAINANSKVTAGAWKALKYLLSDEYQNKFSGDREEDGSGNMSYNFPINKSIIEKRMKNDILPYYYTYTDGNGEVIKEEYGNTVWIGDGEVELRKSTQEDVQKLYDIISSATVVLEDKDAIIKIIMDEAQGYFNGEKDVDSVANIINSRIQLYVNERM